MVAYQRLPCRCPQGRPRCCAVCGCYHTEEVPHNLGSVYYRERFRCKWGRWPTWADAAAHLSFRAGVLWRLAVFAAGFLWTVPPGGGHERIPEPYVPWGIEP